MFTQDVPLDLLPEQISNCWGLSMMTVKNDITGRKNYIEAQFVEFLEFFARLSALKFREGAHKTAKLSKKIEMLMDIAFPIVKSKRKEVIVEIKYVSQSEEELIEDRYLI